MNITMVIPIPRLDSVAYDSYKPYQLFKDTDYLHSISSGKNTGNSAEESLIFNYAVKLGGAGLQVGMKIPELLSKYFIGSNYKLRNQFMRELIRLYCSDRSRSLVEGLYDIIVFQGMDAYEVCKWKEYADGYNVVPLVKDLVGSIAEKIRTKDKEKCLVLSGSWMTERTQELKLLFLNHIILSLNVFLAHIMHYIQIDADESSRCLAVVEKFSDQENFELYYDYEDFFKSYKFEDYPAFEDTTLLNLCLNEKLFASLYSEKYKSLKSVDTYIKRLTTIKTYYEAANGKK